MLLSGATSLRVYKYADRNFYFFGEYHDSGTINGCTDDCDNYDSYYRGLEIKGGNCMTVGALFEMWLQYLFDNKSLTDLYMEVPFTKSKYEEWNQAAYQADIIQGLRDGLSDLEEYEGDDRAEKYGWLGTFFWFYDKCFHPDKTLCKYNPWIRFHYADVRWFNQTMKNYYRKGGAGSLQPDLFILNDEKVFFIIDDAIFFKKNKVLREFAYIISRLLDSDALYRFYMTDENPFDILNEIADLTMKTEIGTWFVNKILTISNLFVIRNGKSHHRTAWEYLRLKKENPKIAEKLHDYFEGYLSEKHIELVNIIRRNLDFLVQDYEINGFTNIANIMALISIWGMDIYTISRMFIFDDSKDVIYFAGDYHSQNMSKFLDTLDAELIFRHDASNTENGVNRCFDITGSSIPNYNLLRKNYTK